ncbi:MAG: HAD family hydrolase [Deltaproteobacteria bacterium]|nr:HAD family hydrolase [Deltaproteobacteria bacterium]
MVPQLLIFDCDGVLIDSEIIVNRVHAEVRTELGYPISTEEMLNRFVGLGSQSKELIDDLKQLPKNYRSILKPKLNEALKNELIPIKGIVPILNKIRIKKCIASGSSIEKLNFTLGLTGINKYFEDKIFSSHMVKNPKPAPDLYLYVAKKMGVKPSQCLVVEDSSTGVKGALNAGMKVIGFMAGSHFTPTLKKKLLFSGAHHFAKSAKDLKTYFQESGILN